MSRARLAPTRKRTIRAFRAASVMALATVRHAMEKAESREMRRVAKTGDLQCGTLPLLLSWHSRLKPASRENRLVDLTKGQSCPKG